MDQGGEEGGSATISSLFHSLGRSLGSSQASVLNAAMQNLVNFELCLLWCIVVPVFILWTDILFSFSYRMLKVLVFLLGKWDILPLYSQCKILCISYHLFILKQYRKCRFFFFLPFKYFCPHLFCFHTYISMFKQFFLPDFNEIYIDSLLLFALEELLWLKSVHASEG